MFDFANQAFTLVILTAMFNVYFIEYIVPGELMANGEMNHTRGRQWWAACGIVGQSLIILVGPVLGAMADFSGAKKKLLMASWIGCVLFTGALGWVPPGDVLAGAGLFVVAYFFYGAGENFMASFLPEVSTHRTMGRVSAFGWTLGYVGGLVCLGGAVGILFMWEAPWAYRLICFWAAGFFLVAGVPTFLWLGERKTAEAMPPGANLFTAGFGRLVETFRDLRRYRWLFQFLITMSIYFSGMQIIFWYAGSLARELFEFGPKKMGLFILQITLTGIVGALVTSWVQDRVGARRYLIVLMAFWSITMLAASLATREPVFWGVGNAIGLGVGALGTASRAMAGLFSPAHKAAEFFGFFGLAHKLAAIIGLGWFTLAEFVFAGNFKYVVASASLFFLAGFVLMWFIDEKAGRIAALRARPRRGRAGGAPSRF